MLKELMENYNEERKICKEESEVFDEKMGEHNRLIKKYEKLIEKHKEKIAKLDDKKYNIESPSWIDTILIPLAEELAKRLNLEYDIYGPFGLRCETTIYFMKDKSISITNQPVKGLTVTPELRENILMYDTGEVEEKYQFGSIGYMNGFGKKSLPLPNDIEDILKLIR